MFLITGLLDDLQSARLNIFSALTDKVEDHRSSSLPQTRWHTSPSCDGMHFYFQPDSVTRYTRSVRFRGNVDGVIWSQGCEADTASRGRNPATPRARHSN